MEKHGTWPWDYVTSGTSKWSCPMGSQQYGNSVHDRISTRDGSLEVQPNDRHVSEIIRERMRTMSRALGMVGKGTNKRDWEEKVKQKKKKGEKLKRCGEEIIKEWFVVCWGLRPENKGNWTWTLALPEAHFVIWDKRPNLCHLHIIICKWPLGAGQGMPALRIPGFWELKEPEIRTVRMRKREW